MRADALRGRLAEAGQLVSWPNAAPAEFGAVSADSRKVAAGCLFIAYAGTTSDGHAFAPAAVQAGAACVMAEHPVGGLAVPQILVHSGRHAAALAAALFYGDPAAELDLLAVTGTNGKTTTAHVLRHLFGDVAPAGSIGTLGAVDGSGRLVPGSGALTTPGPVELQATLAALRDGGVRTVAMEASSHSLDQERLFGLRFRAAVFTNLTRDHLDYHHDEASYLKAKLKLAGYLADGGWEITNADADAWQQLVARSERLTFGIRSPADVRATQIEGDTRGMRFTITARGESARVELPLLGLFQVENALGAAAAALALGRGVTQVAERLSTTPQVAGRMEKIGDAPCLVLRDYAHTPDGLERALEAARPLTNGRLLVVFGCGGDRDRGKRPAMGRIAGRDADMAIVTSDNPRTEDPDVILDDIEEGMGDTPHLRIVDRRTAIARAIAIARHDDLVLLAGKGHEAYQVLGTEQVPFDEAAIVADAVKALAR
jgi:UDP-N-acetylmuramoyl-L-alanyl-D-glutamate--2,6-diaminopimelate ligase